VVLLPGPDDFSCQPPYALTCLLLRFLFQIATTKLCLFSSKACETFEPDSCPFDQDESMPIYDLAMEEETADDNTISVHGKYISTIFPDAQSQMGITTHGILVLLVFGVSEGFSISHPSWAPTPTTQLYLPHCPHTHPYVYTCHEDKCTIATRAETLFFNIRPEFQSWIRRTIATGALHFKLLPTR